MALNIDYIDRKNDQWNVNTNCKACTNIFRASMYGQPLPHIRGHIDHSSQVRGEIGKIMRVVRKKSINSFFVEQFARVEKGCVLEMQ